MSKQKRKYGFVEFFGRYMENLGRLTLVNFLFCIPLAVFIGILYCLNTVGFVNLPIILLVIPFMSPFLAGLFYAALKATREEKVRPVKDFLKGMKENTAYFLLNSVIIYIISLGLSLTFSLYESGESNVLLIISFIMTMLFTVFFVFMENSILTMTVSVELKFFDMVKNSVVLVLGGFLNHLKVLLSFAVLTILLLTMLMAAGGIWKIILIVTPMLLFLPILSAYIIVFLTYQTIELRVIEPFSGEQQDLTEEKNHPDAQMEAEMNIEALEQLAKGDPDEFVYLNGKMLRRSAVRKMLDQGVRTDQPE